MAVLSLRLPASLHNAAREVAQRYGVSLNQLVMTALAEKVAAFKTVDYLRARAEGADESDWDAILAQVPDVEPRAADHYLPQKEALFTRPH